MTKTKKTKQKKISQILQNRQIEQMVNQLELCHRRLETLENLDSPGAWRIAESNSRCWSGNISACLGLSIVAVLTTALFAYFKN